MWPLVMYSYYHIAANFDGGNFDVFDASSQTVKIKPVKF